MSTNATPGGAAGEPHFRALFEAAPDGILLINPDRTCADANRRFSELTGYGLDNLVGRDVMRMVAPEEQGTVLQAVSDLYAGRPYRREWHLRRHDGTHLPVEVSASILSDHCVLLITRDITERQRAQQALADSERHYRELFSQATEAIFQADQDGRYVEVNPAGCALTGYSREEILAMRIGDLADPAERPRIAPLMKQLAEGETIQSEWGFRRRDGARIMLQIKARRMPHGKIQAFAIDITERRRAEEALNESERRFGELMRNVQLIAVVLDARANILYCNPYLLRLTGWQAADVLGHDWYERFMPGGPAPSRFVDALADRPASFVTEGEIVTRTGERRMIRWSATVRRDASGAIAGTAALGEDITERRQSEEALRRRADDLEKFHRLSVGRELQMIELKKRVNALSQRLGEPPPYDLGFTEHP